MLLFISSPWPSLILGVICLAWGFDFIGLKLSEWLDFLIRLPFMFIPDETATERQQLSQPTEEVMVANPGCGLLLAGIILVGFGLFKLFS